MTFYVLIGYIVHFLGLSYIMKTTKDFILNILILRCAFMLCDSSLAGVFRKCVTGVDMVHADHVFETISS